MAEPRLRRMTPEEFYAWDPGDENRYELVDGVPRMMTGASLRHDAVVVNAIRHLGNKLAGSRCRPTTADVAFRSPNGNVRRPDVTVECAPIRDKAYESSAPILVIEVASPSTSEYDRSRKQLEYLNTASLQYVVLVETAEPRVLLQFRSGERWDYRELTALTDTIELAELGISLALAELYEGLDFPAE